jgi:hypothetical protein
MGRGRVLRPSTFPGKTAPPCAGQLSLVETACLNCQQPLQVRASVAAGKGALCSDDCRAEWRRAKYRREGGQARGDGEIYVITDDAGHCKIGWAKVSESRLRILQTGNPRTLRLLAVWSGTHDDERRLHHALRRHRVRGEWFDAAALTSKPLSTMMEAHPYTNGG